MVTCTLRQKVKTWCRLERSLLVEFKGYFGDVPICNLHGRSMSEDGVFELLHEIV